MEDKKKDSQLRLTRKLGVLSLLLLFLLIPEGNCATVDHDKKNDQYRCSVLSFFYVIGSSWDDDPDGIEPFTNAIDMLIDYSEKTTGHSEIDIREVVVEKQSGYVVIGVEFEEDIEDDEIVILGIGEVDGDMFSFRISTNGTTTADCHFTSEATDDSNDTTAVVFTEHVAFWCGRDAFDWERGDDLFVVALTMPGDFSDPMDAMGSYIYWDFAPNEEVPEDDGTTYTGTDPITSFIDYIASILFGFLPGGLSFKFFMVLLIVLGQVFLDRKKKWMRYIGLIFLILLCFPLIMYSLALDFSATMFGINYLSILELLILLNLILYIAFAIMVSFGVLRTKNMFFITASGLMISETVLFLTLFNSGGSTHVFSLIFLVLALAGLLIALILSRKYGRTPKK